MNRFVAAVEKDEVPEYLIGYGKYFVRDFEIAEIHNPTMKWAEVSESFLLGQNYVNEFWKGMMELLKYPDLNLGLWYFNLHLENYIKLFGQDKLTETSEKIIEFISLVKEKKESLEGEKRKQFFLLYDSSNMYDAIKYNMSSVGLEI